LIHLKARAFSSLLSPRRVSATTSNIILEGG
jgi:hypothetical protein